MKQFISLLSSLLILSTAAYYLYNNLTKKHNISDTAVAIELEGEESLKDKAYTADQRAQWEFDMLKDPLTGLIPEGAKASSLRQAKQAKVFGVERNDAGITITPRGPNNLGGRTRAIAFDKRNADIMLAGGVSSGVFRSTNGGASWTKVSSNSEIHNVTTIVQDPRVGQENTWYYGTGEIVGNSASLGAFYNGFGIWKSTDNGLNWVALGTTQSGSYEIFNNPFDFVHRIVVDPTNGDVYAATTDIISRSTDGGATWNPVLGSFSLGVHSDIAVTSTGRLYAAFHGSDSENGVWTTTDGSLGTWTKIGGDGATTNHANWRVRGEYGRIVLGIAPSNENIVYALYYNNTTASCASATTGVEADLFRWNQSTTSWTDLSANLPDEAGCLEGNDPFAVQGGYDLVVGVKPDDANVVFVGGTNAYRSTDGFTSTANTSRIGGYASAGSFAQYANHHPDIHYFAFAPGDNNNLYTGSDGGIARADITNSVVSWTELNNNYVTYQYYHVDIEPTSGNNNLIGGAQDNGSTIIATGDSSGEEIFGGDGVAVGLISATDQDNYNIIVGAQLGSIFRVAKSGGVFSAFSNIRPSSAATSIFVTYFHLDQDNTDILYYAAGEDLYRTHIASTITNTAVTGDPTTGWELMTGVNAAISGNIRSLATSRNNSHNDNAYTSSDADRKLYIGTANGQVFRLDDPAFANAATAPTSISPISSGIVSSISVSPTNQNEVLATFANYNVSSAFHTTDASVASPSWTNIEGNIASSSFRSSAIVSGGANSLYLVGTENGLYCTDNLSGSVAWSAVGISSIGYSVCSSIRYRPSDHNLVVGTHGNGMFQLDVSQAVLPVELMRFSAKAVAQGNQLNWSTASELNNNYFGIEYSQNGTDFQELTTVNGASESLETLEYEFLHKEAKPGATYYRLSQTDLDGTRTNLGIKVVKREADIALAIEPNPVSETLNLRLEYPSDNVGKLNIYSISGQLMFSQNIDVQKGLANYSFNISHLPTGNYILSAEIAGRQYSERFVK